MTRIALNKLHADPRNANRCTADTLDKLQRHIERTLFCPSLLVRPHPTLDEHFVIVDGHHRKQVVDALGWTEIECHVQAMSEEEAGLYLLTLNRLRGTDIPRKRAELLEALLPVFTLDELSSLLPESSGEIEGLLALLKYEEDALAEALNAQIATEAKSLPIPLGFMIPPEDIDVIRQVLALYQAKSKQDEAQALVAICRDVLAFHEVKDG